MSGTHRLQLAAIGVDRDQHHFCAVIVPRGVVTLHLAAL
jgi:hypothetical protein